ncbi:hypothetical protein, partial [Kistimonas scapharcae]|uniref:hypothetical protein n=1 Tax=Kistimonas scapharcae TaxID=1036133 RepID=UPI0031EDFF34
ESVFKTYQNGCSRVTRIGVQVVPEYAPISRSLQQQAWRAVEVFYDEDTLKKYLTERNFTRFTDMYQTS